MGDLKSWPQPSGLLSEATLCSITISSSSNEELWGLAELRIAELIDQIQPNTHSEERRKAVADYVQRLIRRCFDCQVFTFGSVPLKTYLPDGDIDLTAFSRNLYLRDRWANDVLSILEVEGQNRDAEFCVTDVQCIHAEVKIVKCLVENIVVDISFNQLGGLCTLCFLDEVDLLIGQNHLFKRSIILVKAWCYYESRILGAHHGLISTYALETLVMYIFHVFHASLHGPLEVLFRFLDYFNNFDWDTYCISLWGPIPLSALPEMPAKPPRMDGGKLLLSKDFLEACSDVYAVLPKGQDNQSHTFVPKYLNVVDPLRADNNLGRSVSKSNFHRIRSAFGFGARRLAKIFKSPEAEFAKNLENFFSSTWQRRHSGRRPDAPESILLPCETPKPECLGIHGGLEDREGSEEKHQNTKVPFSTDLSKMHMENSQQSAANKLGEFNALVETDANNFKVSSNSVNSSLPSMTSNHSGSSKEVCVISKDSVGFKTETGEAKQCKLGNKGNRTKSAGLALSLRSRSMEKGSHVTSEFMEKSRSQLRKSTSAGRLGDIAVARVFNGSRLARDVHDVANDNLIRKEVGYPEANQSFMKELITEDGRGRYDADSDLITSIETPAMHMSSAETQSKSGFGNLQNGPNKKELDSVVKAFQDGGDNFQHQSLLKDHTSTQPGLPNDFLSSSPLEDQETSSKSGMKDHESSSKSGMKDQEGSNKSGLTNQEYSSKSSLTDQEFSSKSGLKEEESTSISGSLPSLQPCFPHLYGKVPIPFPRAAENPFHMPVPPHLALSMAHTSMPLGGPSPTPLGLHLESPNSSLAYSSASTCISPHSGPYMLPCCPLPPPLPPYLGFPGLALASGMSDEKEGQVPLFQPHGNAKQDLSDFWDQVEHQEQLTANLNEANKNVQPWQLDDSPRFETDARAAEVVRGMDVVGKGSGGIGSKFSKDRTVNQTSPMPGDMTEERRVGNVTATAAEEGAICRLVQSKGDEGVMGGQNLLHFLPSPVVAPGLFVSPNRPPCLPSQTIDTISLSAGFDAQSLPDYPPATVQSLYMTTGSPVVIPSPLYSPNQPVPIVPPIAGGSPSGFHPPVVELSSLALNSSQDKCSSVDNQSSVGASCMYYSAGIPFPPFALYNTFYPIHSVPDDILDTDQISVSTSTIPQEDAINTLLDGSNMHKLRTGPQLGFSVEEGLETASVPISSNTVPKQILSYEAFEEACTEPTTDLLSSDFNSHLRNLKFGRWCQEPSLDAVVFSPPMLQFPTHLHGYHLWEGPGRPVHGGIGLLNGFIPGGPLVQGFGHMNANVLNSFPGHCNFGFEDLPKPRSGTGTYLPSLRYNTNRDRHSLITRNHQGAHSQDQDRDATLGYNLKSRGMGRRLSGHEGRPQVRTTRNVSAERYTGEARSRQENIRRKYSQGTGTFSLANSIATIYEIPSSTSMPQALYGSFPGVAATREREIQSTYSTITSYPYSSVAEPLEFGSFGSMQFGEMMPGQGPSISNHGRSHLSVTGSSTSSSSVSDRGLQATSPMGQQRVNQRSYQLRDEDFPPLSFHGQQGSTSTAVKSSNGTRNRGSHRQA